MPGMAELDRLTPKFNSYERIKELEKQLAAKEAEAGAMREVVLAIQPIQKSLSYLVAVDYLDRWPQNRKLVEAIFEQLSPELFGRIEAALASNAGADLLARLRAAEEKAAALESEVSRLAGQLAAAQSRSDKLRTALIETIRALNGVAEPEVSDGFLLMASQEATAVRERLRAAEELIPFVEKLLDSINADQSQLDTLSNFHQNYQAVVNTLAAIEAARTKEKNEPLT